jgi:hypothetical protein
MDENGQELKVGDTIVFDSAQGISGKSRIVFARIEEISSKGKITVRVYPNVEVSTSNTPTYSSEIVTPNIMFADARVAPGYLQPKRGKQASPGYYRWNSKCDVSIELMDANKIYYQSNCY